MGIGALGAQLAFVHRVALPGLDADNLLVHDNKVEAAPGTAIRTRGWYVLEFHVFTPLCNCRSTGTVYKIDEIFMKNDD
jgi:hypothetical protein